MKPFTLWLPTNIDHYYTFGTVFITYKINSWECICAKFVNPIYATTIDEGRLSFLEKEYTPK